MEFMSGECIYPAPMVSEVERQKRLEEYRLNIYANGCIIEKEWRVHNPVFDEKGEKTTTKMKIRPIRTADELEFIKHTLAIPTKGEE